MGTGIVAFVVGALVGSATIALAWLFYRPVTALFILAAGAAIAYGVTRFGKKRAAPEAQPSAAA